jgi:hypothetical protein
VPSVNYVVTPDLIADTIVCARSGTDMCEKLRSLELKNCVLIPQGNTEEPDVNTRYYLFHTEFCVTQRFEVEGDRASTDTQKLLFLIDGFRTSLLHNL